MLKMLPLRIKTLQVNVKLATIGSFKDLTIFYVE